jgi:ribonucleoside-diphosphate reductase alpha chain
MFRRDIYTIVRAMDNIVDKAIYPLDLQEKEAKSKRRMGLGVTGLANCLEILGMSYGSDSFIRNTGTILKNLRDTAYNTSIELAVEKGAFPLFDSEKYGARGFASELPTGVLEDIKKYGIRNSHLLSIAPTGTISLTADNISSGIEPPYLMEYTRDVMEFDGKKTETVQDYAFREHGVVGRTADKVPVKDHVAVLNAASKLVDSACSKTINEPENMPWEEHKEAYILAYEGGASGCTTHRSGNNREGVLREVVKDDPAVETGAACYIDDKGIRSCE